MTEIEEPTFGICRGCQDYPECLGGHHEDCEIGYENYLNSDDVIVIVKNEDEDKVFHRITCSENLKAVRGVEQVINEEHKYQENFIARKNGIYSLFTCPIIGNGADARFGDVNDWKK